MLRLFSVGLEGVKGSFKFFDWQIAQKPGLFCSVVRK